MQVEGLYPAVRVRESDAVVPCVSDVKTQEVSVVGDPSPAAVGLIQSGIRSDTIEDPWVFVV